MTLQSITETDYVIVGAGSAGCVLAARLSEDGGTQVTLLEAGGRDRDPLIHVPLGWGMIYSRKLHDWRLRTEPETRLDNRIVEFARGKVMGGSSSVNAMAYVRGHRSDFDGWEARGLKGWSYDAVMPWFRKQESWEGGASEWRGASGPLATQYSTYQDPLVEAVFDAGRQAGHGWTDDYNGARQEGFARIQSTIRHGRRCSASVAYLRPALSRSNLRLQLKAHVTRVILENGVARGVEFVSEGQVHRVMARREVILSAGVALSPQLLMLSGIGDAAALTAQGIRVEVDLPQVGRNLRDHVSPVLLFRRREPGPFHAAMRYDRIGRKMMQAMVLGTGLASDVPCGMTAFLRSPLVSGPAPDVQLLLNAAPLSAKPYLRAANSFQDGFGLRVVLLRPESAGTVTLASADPLAPPRIHQDFLQHDHEWRVLRAGIRMVREVARQNALAPFMGGETVPGPDCSDSDADLDRFIRARALTTHHPLGTCAMAQSPAEGVVDAEGRVFGTERLRVIDASIMPGMIGGNINATVIMMAEKLAAGVRGNASL